MNKQKKYTKAEQMAKNELCNLTCLCPKIRAMGDCDKCGVFTSLRDYYEKMEIKSFANSSWEEIADIIDRGKAKDYFAVGDEREETLYTGEKVTLVILGFNHDNRADGKGKATMSIGLKNLIDGLFEMNTECTNEGGWKKSRMRTVYMERLYRLLTDELRKLIVPVYKFASKGCGSTDIVRSEDKLFLLSMAEIFSHKAISNSDWEHIANNADVYNEEGEQYEYFKELIGDADPDKSNEHLVKYKGDSPSATWWWLRSPYAGNSNNFCYVNNNGNVNNNNADNSNGVCFGFCIIIGSTQ